MLDVVGRGPGLRLVELRFMEIQQALGAPAVRHPDMLQLLRSFVEALKAEGFIADALRRSSRRDAVVAPPSA